MSKNTKQNNPACTKRRKYGKNKTPSDDSREQHKLSMDGAPVACSCRRETEVISNIVKEVTHSLPFLSVLNVCALSHISKIFKQF